MCVEFTDPANFKLCDDVKSKDLTQAPFFYVQLKDKFY